MMIGMKMKKITTGVVFAIIAVCFVPLSGLLAMVLLILAIATIISGIIDAG